MNTLNTDIVLSIVLQYLGEINDVKNASLVCKSWYNYIDVKNLVDHCISRFSQICFHCRKPTRDHMFQLQNKKDNMFIALCRLCKSQYMVTLFGTRYGAVIYKTYAEKNYKLNDYEFAHLPHCTEPSAYSPNKTNKLYMTSMIESVALRKYTTVQNLEYALHGKEREKQEKELQKQTFQKETIAPLMQAIAQATGCSEEARLQVAAIQVYALQRKQDGWTKEEIAQSFPEKVDCLPSMLKGKGWTEITTQYMNQHQPQVSPSLKRPAETVEAKNAPAKKRPRK